MPHCQVYFISSVCHDLFAQAYYVSELLTNFLAAAINYCIVLALDVVLHRRLHSCEAARAPLFCAQELALKHYLLDDGHEFAIDFLLLSIDLFFGDCGEVLEYVFILLAAALAWEMSQLCCQSSQRHSPHRYEKLSEGWRNSE